MTAQLGLTVKHVGKDSTTYIAATAVEYITGQTSGAYLKIECGDDGGRREAHGGKAYILNVAGKTVDVLDLEWKPSPQAIGIQQAINQMNLNTYNAYADPGKL